MTSEIVSKEEQEAIHDIQRRFFDTYRLAVSNFAVHSVSDRSDWDKDAAYHLIAPFNLELVLNARRVSILDVPNVKYEQLFKEFFLIH